MEMDKDKVRKIFLIIYAILIPSLVVYFLVFGERKDPRFWIIMLVLPIIGKIIEGYLGKGDKS